MRAAVSILLTATLATALPQGSVGGKELLDFVPFEKICDGSELLQLLGGKDGGLNKVTATCGTFQTCGFLDDKRLEPLHNDLQKQFGFENMDACLAGFKQPPQEQCDNVIKSMTTCKGEFPFGVEVDSACGKGFFCKKFGPDSGFTDEEKKFLKFFLGYESEERCLEAEMNSLVLGSETRRSCNNPIVPLRKYKKGPNNPESKDSETLKEAISGDPKSDDPKSDDPKSDE